MIMYIKEKEKTNPHEEEEEEETISVAGSSGAHEEMCPLISTLII